MITITYYDKEKNEYIEQNILTVLDGMTWSGAKDQGPRSLNFEFLYKLINQDVPKYSVATGDKVVWNENDKVLFQGYIETLDYNTDNDTILVNCKDLIARLMRSKFIGRMQGTLNQLADKICGIFDINNGINTEHTHIHNIVSTGNMTYYEVLKEACDTLFKRYNLYMDGTTLKLAEQKSQATFEIGKNIRASSFTQSVDNLVTKVLIINNDGQVIGSRQNEELLQQFGLFQEVYSYNEDIKNNTEEADKIISDSVTKKGQIIVNNNNNCIAGRFIEVYETSNNFKGTFEIISDSHNIGIDSYMTLEIKMVDELSA